MKRKSILFGLMVLGMMFIGLGNVHADLAGGFRNGSGDTGLLQKASGFCPVTATSPACSPVSQLYGVRITFVYYNGSTYEKIGHSVDLWNEYFDVYNSYMLGHYGINNLITYWGNSAKWESFSEGNIQNSSSSTYYYSRFQTMLGTSHNFQSLSSNVMTYLGGEDGTKIDENELKQKYQDLAKLAGIDWNTLTKESIAEPSLEAKGYRMFVEPLRVWTYKQKLAVFTYSELAKLGNTTSNAEDYYGFGKNSGPRVMHTMRHDVGIYNGDQDASGNAISGMGNTADRTIGLALHIHSFNQIIKSNDCHDQEYEIFAEYFNTTSNVAARYCSSLLSGIDGIKAASDCIEEKKIENDKAYNTYFQKRMELDREYPNECPFDPDHPFDPNPKDPDSEDPGDSTGKYCEVETVGGKTIYYGKNGNEVSRKQFLEECNPKCDVVNGTYYGPNGEVLKDLVEYLKACPLSSSTCDDLKEQIQVQVDMANKKCIQENYTNPAGVLDMITHCIEEARKINEEMNAMYEQKCPAQICDLDNPNTWKGNGNYCCSYYENLFTNELFVNDAETAKLLYEKFLDIPMDGSQTIRDFCERTDGLKCNINDPIFTQECCSILEEQYPEKPGEFWDEHGCGRNELKCTVEDYHIDFPADVDGMPTSCDGSTTGTIKDIYDWTCIFESDQIPETAPNGKYRDNYLIFSNPYCAVYCREDVEYTFPNGGTSVLAGYRFTVGERKANVPAWEPLKFTSTRTCRTGPSVQESEKNPTIVNSGYNAYYKRVMEIFSSARREVNYQRKEEGQTLGNICPSGYETKGCDYTDSGFCYDGGDNGNGDYYVYCKETDEHFKKRIESLIESAKRKYNPYCEGVCTYQDYSVKIDDVTFSANFGWNYIESTAINVEKFVADWEKQNDAVIAAWDNYQKAIAHVESFGRARSNKCEPICHETEDGKEECCSAYSMDAGEETSYTDFNGDTKTYQESEGCTCNSVFGIRSQAAIEARDAAKQAYEDAKKELAQMENDINTCSNWQGFSTSDLVSNTDIHAKRYSKYKTYDEFKQYYEFEPDLDLDYEDPTKDTYKYKDELKRSTDVPDPEVHYYDYQSTGSIEKGSSTIVNRGDKYTCPEECDYYGCSTCKKSTDWSYADNDEIKAILNKTVSYTLKDHVFDTVIKPKGESIHSTDKGKYPDQKFIDIGYSSLPVHFMTPTGVYHIGLSYDSFTPHQLNIKDSSINHNFNDIVFGENGSTLEYSCAYEVTNNIIPECDPDREICLPLPPACKEDVCTPLAGGLNVIYRPISLEKPFPGEEGDSRPSGSNWSAQDELNYITNNRGVYGSEIYHTEGLEPMYTIRLTPDIIKEIRVYNKKVDNGYADFDLNCMNGHLQCQSNFLRTADFGTLTIGGKTVSWIDDDTCGMSNNWNQCQVDDDQRISREAGVSE